MPRMSSSHVTFGTPAHFVMDQIKEHFPHADFTRPSFLETLAQSGIDFRLPCCLLSFFCLWSLVQTRCVPG